MVAAPVLAQRSNLSDRVAALEQRAADGNNPETSANLDLINQINQLRDDLRDLRNEIEQLQQHSQQVQAVARSQYLDLDDRLEQLERGRESTFSAKPEADAPAPVLVANIDSSGNENAAPPPHAVVAGNSEDSTNEDAAEVAASVDGEEEVITPRDERSSYEAAFDALKTGRYKESAQLFSTFLLAFPNGSHAPNARYWLGESYYVVEDYVRAEVQFRALIARWPDSDKAPGALLKVGLSQYGQKHYDAAEDTLAEVEERYPGTDAAKTAADRLRAIQVSRLN